ncbi:MAG: alpha/beta hydrolase [Chitinophagaceae bacterium]|nr:alpha/beta hydrolase [Chitinophagaceae bacterium]
MESFNLKYKSSQINYIRFGSGPKTVVCFHGYGEDSSGFRFLNSLSLTDYLFLAIDLPCHGRTTWNERKAFSINDLLSIVDAILAQQGIEGKLQFSVIGFSLGARVALRLYEKAPERINRLVLLAPDGMKLNFWYWLSTQTWLGNKFFRLTMKHPHWFFGFLKLLNKLGFVNTSIFKFVNAYIGNSKVRDALYNRWTGLRDIRPNLAKIKKEIKINKTPVRLIYGRHDRIILPTRGHRFISGIESHATLTIIDSGHQVLSPRHVSHIQKALYGE